MQKGTNYFNDSATVEDQLLSCSSASSLYQQGCRYWLSANLYAMTSLWKPHCMFVKLELSNF